LILASAVHFSDWRQIFWLCAGGFVLLGVAAPMVDSTRPLKA
jgi:hypothetical protein